MTDGDVDVVVTGGNRIGGLPQIEQRPGDERRAQKRDQHAAQQRQ